MVNESLHQKTPKDFDLSSLVYSDLEINVIFSGSAL